MNFNLSEEQGLIRDSIARFVSENYEFDKRNSYVAMDHGYSTDNWQQFAELGWLSIPFAEEQGGFGGGPVDTMVIMQEFGRGLVAEPYLPTVVLFSGLKMVSLERFQKFTHGQVRDGEVNLPLKQLQSHQNPWIGTSTVVWPAKSLM